MPFDYHIESKLHHVPQLKGAPECVHFADVFGTPGESKDKLSPLTGSLFVLEFSDNPTPPPTYDYDETGVVLKGELKLQDEAGVTATLLPGDTFFIHRGSTITFSTSRFAVAFKAAARWKGL